MSGVRCQATEYVVCALPEGHVDEHVFAVTVSYRGPDSWAVIRHARCLSRSGAWSHESIPSERGDAWIREHRFSLGEALALAQEQAPLVTVNGWTVPMVRERDGIELADV